jgi:pyridoxamine 5'-phosphate oxidase
MEGVSSGIPATTTFGRDLDDPDVIEPDPFAVLRLWIPQPTDESRPLMTVTTVSLSGYPDSRNVLLSSFDGATFSFHTDSRSRKSGELAGNGAVSLVFVWPEVGRQLAVVGDAVQVSGDEAAVAYAERSRYLQLLAWLNTVEIAQLPAAERRARWNAFSEENPDGTLSAPDSWVGYRVTPRRLTFWRGDPDGPSNRVEYALGDTGTWTAERLPG